MDGLIVLGRSGRPIVQSRFRNRHATYPLLHVDYLNSVLRKARKEGNERDVPPVLVVPVAEDMLQTHESAHTEVVDESNESENEAQEEEANVWNAPNTVATDKTDEEAEADQPESGAVLCHIQVGELRFLCPVSRHSRYHTDSVNPLVPLDFLRKVVEVLQVYLVGSDDTFLLTEDLIAEHFDVVYQLLEEMLDGEGNVLLTEVNALKDIVLPPSWLDRLVSTVGLGRFVARHLHSASERARPALMSPVPWRRSTSKYTKNEFYLDFVEQIEGIVTAAGKPIALDLTGRIEGTAWLNGTPELTVLLTSPTFVQDAVWHACVRRKNWTHSHTLNFIPPDGRFELGSYRLATPVAKDTPAALGRSSMSSFDSLVPLTVDVQLEDWDAKHGTHGFSITLGSKLGTPRTLTDIVVEWELGDRVQGVDATVSDLRIPSSAQSISQLSSTPEPNGNGAPQTDTAVFDKKHQLLRWTTASLGTGTSTKLMGNILAHGSPCRPSYALQVRFAMAGHSLSGLRAKEIRIDIPTTALSKGIRNHFMGALEWRI